MRNGRRRGARAAVTLCSVERGARRVHPDRGGAGFERQTWLGLSRSFDTMRSTIQPMSAIGSTVKNRNENSPASAPNSAMTTFTVISPITASTPPVNSLEPMTPSIRVTCKPYVICRHQDSAGRRWPRAAGAGTFARLLDRGSRVRAASLVLLALLPGCGVLPTLGGGGPQLSGRMRIERDEWGVPHITGRTDAAVAFGLGYAQAEDDLRGIEDNVLRAIGRAANLYGDAELPNDLLKAAFEVPRHARAEYAREPEERRRVWDAFVAGMNHYLAEHPSARLRVLARFEPWHLFALARDLPPGMQVDGVRLGDAAAMAATLPGGAVAVASYDTAAPGEARPDTARASIAWAIAPARADSGHALLLHSLDRPFGGAGQPYEAHLQSDEGWRMSGYADLGTPVLRTGHTGHHAWAHTESASDTRDAWLLRFDHPSDPLAYRWDGGWRTAEPFTDTISVNTTQGVVRRPYTFLRTPLGPVVARHGDNAAVAVRIARMEEGGALQQWHAMARARSLDEFRAALALTALVGVNTMYADTAGNILYAHGSAVPRRAAGIDPARVLDGSDTTTVWGGYHALSELPEVLNPGSGWLESAGGTPLHTDAGSIDAARYPAYITGGADNARARRARELLRVEQGWTREELETVAFDVRATAAAPLLRRLVDEYEQRGALDPVGVLPLDEAVQRLRAWDSRASVESTEMTLFVTWYERLQSPFASIGAGWPLTRALGWALERLEQEWGTTEVPWGTLNRHVRPGAAAADSAGVALPGGAAWTGSLFGAAPVTGASGSARRLATGIAWSSVVELAPQPVGHTVVAYGQSGDPASRHFFDQARLMAQGRMKPAAGPDPQPAPPVR